MRDAKNPQMREMADPSMVRTLAAQAELIWPQEQALFARYDLGPAPRILDVGCGTGELGHRLLGLLPEATIIGVDVVETHVAEARRRYADHAGKLSFEIADAMDLPFGDDDFDLVACRHVLQAVGDPEGLVRELMRVTRPGGRLHLIAEDYGMVAAETGTLDPDDFWSVIPRQFGDGVGTDMRIGRRTYRLLKEAGAEAIGLDYVVVDTLRCPREVIVEMLSAWRDGFSEGIGEHTTLSETEARQHFDAMIATVRDPEGYFVWFVPVFSAVI